MKNLMLKIYDRLSMIPIALFVFAGIYEMFIGDMMRGIINGDVSWIIPVTKTMLIDTALFLIIMCFIINGLPKFIKKLSGNQKTKNFPALIIALFVIAAIWLYAYGKKEFDQKLFELNYPVFMAVLFVVCVIQKLVGDVLYPDKKKNYYNRKDELLCH